MMMRGPTIPWTRPVVVEIVLPEIVVRRGKNQSVEALVVVRGTSGAVCGMAGLLAGFVAGQN
jgi:hypothetical protein